MEGSVRKAGNRLRITGQLIDAADGTHLWADRFEGALEDVFERQDRVTTGVVGIITPKVQQAGNALLRLRERTMAGLRSGAFPSDCEFELVRSSAGRHRPCRT